MAEAGMTLNVSPDLIRPVIEAKIQAAIIEALGKGTMDATLATVINKALTTKVNADGKVGDYSSYNTIPLIEWLCMDAIRKCAQDGIKAWIEANRPAFQKHFEVELNRQSKTMAKVFLDGIQESMKSTWNFKVDVGFAKPGKD